MWHEEDRSVSAFGDLVRAHRLAAGLTQQELATKSGLSIAALRDYEQSRRRRPRAGSLAALVGALGLNADQTGTLERTVKRAWHGVGAMSRADHGRGVPSAGLGQREPVRGLLVAALGPLEAWWDGVPLSLGPPAQRAVLGLLVMSPGVPVRRSTIVDVLWGDAPPRTAVGVVQAHVSRLRKALTPPGRSAEDDAQIISLINAGYVLHLSENGLDVLAFRDLAGRAAIALASGDDAAAFDFYERAIALWQSDPLADVELLRGHPSVTHLRQELVSVLLQYADVACALGRYHRILPRLRALAAAEPLNEPAHARLMITLAGSGEQAAAIRVYEDLRLRLDRELGLYPGEELVEAHMRVLRRGIRRMPETG
jgi:DNA-binding SARP family transcriptional activator/transcriptional regulator with XRE-family HTH domain